MSQGLRKKSINLVEFCQLVNTYHPIDYQNDKSTNTSFIFRIPDVPAAPSLVTLIERTADMIIDQRSLDDDPDEMVSNNTQQQQPQAVDAAPISGEPLDMYPDSQSAQNTITPAEQRKEVTPAQDQGSTDGQGNITNDSGSDNFVEALIVPTTTDSSQTDKSTSEATTENLTRVDESQIPLFSEWAQKRMEEAEKELEQDAVNSSTMKKNTTASHKTATVLKMRAKNYASPDCGAKIIAANSEASNTREVLTATKDEYLLSPCNSRIWFVVELCEAIQAEIIDLANFELFSSSPKNFSVAVSNRFPTRDWSQVGKFEARDERNIQSFDLYPHMFGKYVRVDIHSHYSSEHFCPISLFRVFGTSEFEAFETENRLTDEGDDDNGDDDLEAITTAAKDDSNIFKSASDAVMSIVKKAAATFVKPSDNKTEGGQVVVNIPLVPPTSTCVSPNRLVLCKKCSENLTEAVTEMLNCKQPELMGLLKVELIKKSVSRSQICANLVGVDLSDCRVDFSITEPHRDYISHLFPERYVAAMCNLLTTGISRRIFRKNDSLESDQRDDGTLTNITIDKETGGEHGKLLLPAQQPKIPKKNVVSEDRPIPERPVWVADQLLEIPAHPHYYDDAKLEVGQPEVPAEDPVISPTKVEEESLSTQIQPPPISDSYDVDHPSVIKTEDVSEMPFTTETSQIDPVISTEVMDDFKILGETVEWDTNGDGGVVTTTVIPETVDLGMSEETITGNGGSTVPQTGQKVQSESVFLRLTNRVKVKSSRI